MAMPNSYTIAQLTNAMAFAKRHPTTGRIHVPWADWTQQDFTGEEWRAWFRACLLHKIQRHEPCRGRKDSRDWFMEQWRASRQLNQPRLLIDWLPRDLAQRFPHRLRRNIPDL